MDKPQQGPNKIVCYCTKCGKEITESAGLSKKYIKSYWDEMVMQAPLLMKCECHTEQPNMNLRFTIRRTAITKNGKAKEQTPLEFGLKTKAGAFEKLQKDYDNLMPQSAMVAAAVDKKMQENEPGTES